MAYCTKCGKEVDTEKCAGQEYCKVCGHIVELIKAFADYMTCTSMPFFRSISKGDRN